MILDKDLEIIAEDIYTNGFSNASIMVTGSTGLLGSLVVKGFLVANKKYGLNNQVFALARNLSKANIVFKDFVSDQNLKIVENEITKPININSKIDYIFHTACVTTSKEMVEKPIEVVKGSVIGTMNTLDFAKEKSSSVVYLSSMEVYGKNDLYTNRLKENDLGYIDLTSVRSCYPESKRLCENLCKCYAEEYGLNVTTARLTQTFGAGADINDNRIFALIAKSVIYNQDLTLKTRGLLTRDYCYTTDAISAMLILAKNGTKGETYNIANEDTNTSIFNMASQVLEKLGNGSNKVIIEQSGNAPKEFSPESITKLNTQKIRDLGWNHKFKLLDMYQRLIEHYKEIINQEK